MNAQEYFEKKLMPLAASNPDKLSHLGFRSQNVGVKVTGDGGGEWTLCFDDKGIIQLLKGLHTPQCTIEDNDKTFAGLLDGSISGLKIGFAVAMGKIKIHGDKGLAARIAGAVRELAK